MGKIRFIGDTHFNHRNIISYTSRTKYFDIGDVETMEDEIVRRWNSVTDKDDLVYHVGDFGFGTEEEIKRLLSRLNGTVRLLLGNHDKRRTPHWYDDLGFDAVYEFPFILEDWFIVSHEPIKYLTNKMPYINIHGHTHDEEYKNPRRVNVCWEVLDGYPVDFEEIKARFINIDSFDLASKVYVKDKPKNDSMNYNEGYLQGFIDAKKSEENK